MEKSALIKLKEQLSKLSYFEEKQRNLYLKQLLENEIQGPLTGIPSIDKPWLKYYTNEQIETDMPKMSAYKYLFERNKKFLGRIALSYYGKKITFDELFMRIEETAKALKMMGVKENDIVTISLPNTPEAVYLFYAMSKIGAIANMVDPRTSVEGLKNYIEEVESDLVIIVDSCYNKVKKLRKESVVKQIVAVSPAESLPFGLKIGYKTKEIINNLKNPKEKIVLEDGTINWSQFITNGAEYRINTEAEFKNNRPLAIEHTGGTTGVPKGVVLSNENINAVALQSVLTGIDMQREHNWLDIMPTFIAYGVGMGLHLPLTIGMETILIPQFNPAKFDELLLKYKPIHMVGVPSYWGTIIKSKKLANKDLSYIIAPTVGGDAMDRTLEEQANAYLKEHNCSSKITKGYGMTEVTGGVAGTVDENNHIGSVGIPFVKTTISVFEPGTEEELMYGVDGEVCITGPNTMLGYFNNSEATEQILKRHNDGKIWVHTGDIGHINEDGSLFIVDRIKRMMIRYDGFKIFPSLIENVIGKHEAVEGCKVVAIADQDHSQGKLPKAHIVLKPQYKDKEDIVLEQIKLLCLEQLPEYVQPVAYKFRESLPLTAVGKIDYIALEKEDENIKNKSSQMVLKKV